MRKVSIVIICLLMISNFSFAQHEQNKGLIGGTSLNVMILQGELAERYELGVGIYADYDYNFNKHFALRFDIGYNTLNGSEKTFVDVQGNEHTYHSSLSTWEFSSGIKASASIFYAEIKGGYFSAFHTFGFVPAAGLRIGKFDVQGSYNLVSDYEWVALRIGYYWANGLKK